jgi:hypothetical protein
MQSQNSLDKKGAGKSRLFLYSRELLKPHSKNSVALEVWEKDLRHKFL